MIFPQSTIFVACLFVGLSSAVTADTAKSRFAVFTQKDPTFSETVILYSDGKYQQSETQLSTYLRHCYSTADPTPHSAFPGFGVKIKREGTWRVLDKEGGLPITLKPGASIPNGAVITLKNAMPFGFVWDNQLPYQLHTDRMLPASAFQLEDLPTEASGRKTLVLGTPLTPLVEK